MLLVKRLPLLSKSARMTPPKSADLLARSTVSRLLNTSQCQTLNMFFSTLSSKLIGLPLNSFLAKQRNAVSGLLAF